MQFFLRLHRAGFVTFHESVAYFHEDTNILVNGFLYLNALMKLDEATSLI